MARMPSIPTGVDGRFFEESDMMDLDDMLNFDIGPRDGAGPSGAAANAVETHAYYSSDAPHSLTSSGEDQGYSSGQGLSLSPNGETFQFQMSAGTPGAEDLDPNDPKYKRRIQNRMASARFRAKAKERQMELDRLKTQVLQLRREKAALEDQCRRLNIAIETEGEKQRKSTLAWVIDHFWLRRKVHLKTLANSVRWMIRGQYKSGMTEVVLRAKDANDAAKAAAAGGGDGNSHPKEEAVDEPSSSTAREAAEASLTTTKSIDSNWGLLKSLWGADDPKPQDPPGSLS